MAKVQIKSEKLTSFGGIFPIMEKFDRMLSCTIDSTLGLRSKVYGYQYSEIIRSLMCVYFCGGSCVEDVTSHLMEALCLHPPLRTCHQTQQTLLGAYEERQPKQVILLWCRSYLLGLKGCLEPLNEFC